MAETVTFESGRARVLQRRMNRLNAQRPSLRGRPMAAALGVSELELTALRCGRDAVRLCADRALGPAVQTLGPVVLVTAFGAGALAASQGTGATGNHFELPADGGSRLFATTEMLARGPRRALRAFTADGAALYTVYLDARSNHGAFQALVDAQRAPDQGPWESLHPPCTPGLRPPAGGRALPACCLPLLLQALCNRRTPVRLALSRTGGPETAARRCAQVVEGVATAVHAHGRALVLRGRDFELDLREPDGVRLWLLSGGRGPRLEVHPAGHRQRLRLDAGSGRRPAGAFRQALNAATGLDL